MLLERDQLGSGSTSKAAGGVRAQFSDPLNIRIAKRSLERTRTSRAARAGRSTATRSATCSCSRAEGEVDAFTRNVALQNELGVPSRIIRRGGARAVPADRRASDMLAASYSPEEATRRPRPSSGLRLRRAPARRASADGPRGRRHRHRDGKVSAVVRRTVKWRPDTVICAAGAWSRLCGEMVGVQLAVSPLRRQVLFTEPMDGLPGGFR